MPEIPTGIHRHSRIYGHQLANFQRCTAPLRQLTGQPNCVTRCQQQVIPAWALVAGKLPRPLYQRIASNAGRAPAKPDQPRQTATWHGDPLGSVRDVRQNPRPQWMPPPKKPGIRCRIEDSRPRAIGKTVRSTRPPCRLVCLTGQPCRVATVLSVVNP